VDLRPVRLGLLGCGTVGGALADLLADEAAAIEARTDLHLAVGPVAVRDVDKARVRSIDRAQLTTDAEAVVDDPAVDVVVELMGGIEPARTLVLRALAAGKPVVTANKALLATHGDELAAAAERSGVDLLFEAAVGGGIPIIRPLRESLLGEPILRVMGIVNGTTNYILTRMAEDGADYGDALAEAQRLGYAEADPTADVGGGDAAAKLAILASIAFGSRVVLDDVHVEGITGITTSDIDFAGRNGLVIKLLAIGERAGSGVLPGTTPEPRASRVAVRVHPTLVPATHPLASVRDSFNAVFVEGAAVGELMFYGRGAGGSPTASAVLGDVVDAALNLRRGTAARLGALPRADVEPVAELISQYYLAIDVVDRHGVLAAVAGAFAANQVSIRSVVQEGAHDEASMVFITHSAREADVQATLDDLRGLDAVRRVGSVLRLIGGAA
jgi:homoserine dehydrogenase